MKNSSQMFGRWKRLNAEEAVCIALWSYNVAAPLLMSHERTTTAFQDVVYAVAGFLNLCNGTQSGCHTPELKAAVSHDEPSQEVCIRSASWSESLRAEERRSLLAHVPLSRLSHRRF